MAEWTLTGPEQAASSPSWQLTGPDKEEEKPSFLNNLVSKAADAFQLANEHPGYALGESVGKIVGMKNPESLGHEGEALLNSLGPLGAEFAPLNAVGKLETSLRPPPKASSSAIETPKVPGNKVVPTTEEIKKMSQQAYKEASDAGVLVKPESYNNMVRGAVAKLQQEKINPKLHGDTHAAAQQLIQNIVRSRAPDAMSRLTGVTPKAPTKTFDLQELDTLRQVAGIAERGFDPQKAADRRLAGIVTSHIDDWVRNLTSKDVAAGDPQKAAFAIKQARALWHRMRNAEMLDTVHERALNRVGANYSANQLQTAYRQEFKAIANNPSKFRHFNKAEQQAITSIVRGDKVENVLRYLGKFAPNSPMSLFLSGGTGYMFGGPIGAAALAAGGTAAKFASNKMSQGKIDALNALVRRGY